MNETQMLIVAMVLGLALVSVITYVAYNYGLLRGRDLQRIEDIEEMWSNMPRRDSRGRFAAHK